MNDKNKNENEKPLAGKMLALANEIGEAIIDALTGEKLPPWQAPFDGYGTSIFSDAYNAASGNAYHGINALACAAATLKRGFETPAFLTFKQALDLGGNVRKGERGFHVVKYGRERKVDPKTGDETESFFVLMFTVFNVAQCENIDGKKVKAEKNTIIPKTAKFDANARAEKIIKDNGVPVQEKKNRGFAFYSPNGKKIVVPHRNFFENVQGFYSTVFHELAHATADSLGMNFGGYNTTEGRAREEAAVEIAAMLICGKLGIAKPESDANHKSYAQSWLNVVLKKDKSEAFKAFRAATKLADEILKHDEIISAENEAARKAWEQAGKARKAA